MKTFLSNSNNIKGFSLVELMVVVAIIGVLASIGLPQYKKYRAKAFESEAKSHLATIYTAETSFFVEYSEYHHSLKVIGYSPVGNNRYVAGFSAPRAAATFPAHLPDESWFIHTQRICSGPNGTGTDTNCTMNITVPEISYQTAAVATASTFNAIAIASEDSLLAETMTTSNPLVNYALNAIGEINKANARLGPPLIGANRYRTSKCRYGFLGNKSE